MGDLEASRIGDTENIADQTFHRYTPANACEPWADGHAVHAPVASFAEGANPFGLYDVLGNVREWCRDAYDESAYTSPADDRGDRSGAPVDVRARVNRGGSWSDTGLFARASYRAGIAPSNRDASLGIRPSRAVAGEIGR
jgi:formylglycine-generating enzyme required for sulfatase activity